MAYATRTYTPGSSTTTFALTTSGGDPIGYIQESDIAVKVNGTTYTNAASGTNTYQITGSSTVEQPNGGNVVLNAGVTGTVVQIELQLYKTQLLFIRLVLLLHLLTLITQITRLDLVYKSSLMTTQLCLLVLVL